VTEIERKMLKQILKNQMALMCYLNYHEKEKLKGSFRSQTAMQANMKHTRLLLEETQTNVAFNVPSTLIPSTRKGA
jgi:hypothetical protein